MKLFKTRSRRQRMQARERRSFVVENDIYSDGGREQLIEDDEATAEEVAFMRGYDER